VLILTPSGGKEVNRDALASALNIIHFLLFGGPLEVSNMNSDLDATDTQVRVRVRVKEL
jgi:hypothetical protein